MSQYTWVYCDQRQGSWARWALGWACWGRRQALRRGRWGAGATGALARAGVRRRRARARAGRARVGAAGGQAGRWA